MPFDCSAPALVNARRKDKEAEPCNYLSQTEAFFFFFLYINPATLSTDGLKWFKMAAVI